MTGVKCNMCNTNLKKKTSRYHTVVHNTYHTSLNNSVTSRTVTFCVLNFTSITLNIFIPNIKKSNAKGNLLKYSGNMGLRRLLHYPNNGNSNFLQKSAHQIMVVVRLTITEAARVTTSHFSDSE